MHPRESGDFMRMGISGGHHAPELLRYVEAHPRFALHETTVRNTAGITMRRFEQYKWAGTGAKPMRGSGMAPGERNFRPDLWEHAAVPKTTFDRPAEFLLEAERAWATWVPPATIAVNTPFTVTAPGSGIRCGGYVNPGPTVTTIYPDATWL
jgi:hypothetical protein